MSPMRTRELSVGRVLLVYLAGLIAGVQGALYLYDTFDDGVSEPLSGMIALAFAAAGLGFVAWCFRGRRGAPGGG